MTQEELQECLRLHKMWLSDEEGGVRANLSKADLRKAVLSNADLRWTNLIGAVLIGADLSGADLREAVLSGADLRGANLSNADLSKADLSKADLSGANLSNADLRWANLSRAKDYYSFVAYDTSKRTVHCFKNEGTWMIKAGCFWDTLDELEKKVKETHNSKIYLANIDILRWL